MNTGTYHVEPKDLAKIRAAIDYDNSGMDTLLKSSGYQQVFEGNLFGDRVKSAQVD